MGIYLGQLDAVHIIVYVQLYERACYLCSVKSNLEKKNTYFLIGVFLANWLINKGKDFSFTYFLIFISTIVFVFMFMLMTFFTMPTLATETIAIR